MAKKKRCGLGSVYDENIGKCRKLTKAEKTELNVATAGGAMAGSQIVGGLSGKGRPSAAGAIVGGLLERSYVKKRYGKKKKK